MIAFGYSLSYETSLELVHNAAKEYFNSAQGFMDSDMDLARSDDLLMQIVLC